MHNYTQANRTNWNAWTEINATSAFYDVAGFKSGKSTLHSIERDELGDVSGKTLLHLQCHFGLDTLSWARLGAKVTGVDFSDKSIALAQSLAQELGLDARFICSDIYDLPNVLNEKFDIVFTSYGVLFWLSDLQKWGEIVAHFLKPGGIFYIVEHHPFANVYDENNPTDLQILYPYFHTAEPVGLETQGTYADPDATYSTTEYAWSYGLGEVINALIDAGPRIEYVHEFPYCNSQRFAILEQGEDGFWHWKDHKNTIPLLFSLKATLRGKQ